MSDHCFAPRGYDWQPHPDDRGNRAERATPADDLAGTSKGGPR